MKAKTLLKRLWNEEDGVTLIEYSLLAALIAVVSISILTTIGKNAVETLTTVSDALEGEPSSGGGGGGGHGH